MQIQRQGRSEDRAQLSDILNTYGMGDWIEDWVWHAIFEMYTHK